MQKSKAVSKILSFIIMFSFLLGITYVPVSASSSLSTSLKNAYVRTLELRSDWGDISEICYKSVNEQKIFADYYEALDAYDMDPDNAYYGSVYIAPKKSSQKTSYSLGTPVDFTEYNIVGFLNDDDMRDVVIYKCKGTLWMRKTAGEYIIMKAKRTITPIEDIEEDIDDSEIVDLLMEQIDSFLGEDDYYEDEKVSEDIRLSITSCPTTSTKATVTIAGKVIYEGEDSYNVTINGDNVDVNEYSGTWSQEVTLKEGTNTFIIEAATDSGATDKITKTIKFQVDAPSLVISQCPETSALSEVTVTGRVTDKNDKNPKVYVNGDLMVVDYYGNWSTTITLKEGANPIEFKATNSIGKSTVINKTINFSTDGPTIVITACPDSSTKKTVTISGRVTDSNDKNPKLYINDEQVNVNSYYGTWDKELALKEGTNTFVIKATNSLGKTTTITKTVIFSSGAPDLVITSCPETSTIKTVTISGRVSDTNDKNPKVYINDELLSVNSYYGTWEKEVTLKEGENTFAIKATNSLGKTTTVTKIITFTSGAPDLVITNCPETSTVKTVTLSGRVADTNDKNPKVYINDELLSVNSYYGTWSKDVTLKEGTNTFTIKATNALGKSTVLTRTVTFSVAAPDLIISNCPDSSTTGKVTISGSVSDSNDSNPKVYINDDLLSLSWNKTWSKEVVLKEGTNTFIIKATNNLGKTTTITKTINFTVEAPSIVISNCPETSTSKTVTISGRVSDTNDRYPKMYINGELLSLGWDNTWSKTVTLSEGVNSLEIKATNSYGKATILTKTILYGYVTPTLQVLVCPDNSNTDKVVISGTVSDISDSNPSVYVNDVPVTTSGGAWSKEVTLIKGTNTITIKAVNKGGKQAIITKTITYIPAPEPTPTVEPTPTPTVEPTPTPAS